MVDIPSQLTDPVGVVPVVSAKMRALTHIAHKLVEENNPKRVWNMARTWEALDKESLGVAKKDFPVFQRLVNEELKRRCPNLEGLHTDKDSDADSEDLLEDTPNAKNSDVDLFQTTIAQIARDSDDSEQEPGPSQLEIPEVSVSRTKSKTVTPKRSKLVTPESPPKSPIIVAKKSVKFGKPAKRSFATLNGKYQRHLYI